MAGLFSLACFLSSNPYKVVLNDCIHYYGEHRMVWLVWLIDDLQKNASGRFWTDWQHSFPSQWKHRIRLVESIPRPTATVLAPCCSPKPPLRDLREEKKNNITCFFSESVWTETILSTIVFTLSLCHHGKNEDLEIPTTARTTTNVSVCILASYYSFFYFTEYVNFKLGHLH